jgi:lysophospholipase L1-like esterase
MRGSSGTIFHRIDTELLAESYKAMNARLVIMEYGGNLVPSTSSSNIEWTKKLITRQIQAVQKANPDADILFIGPADMARQKDGQWQTYAALNMTIKALREVALDNGAAYWDMHRVMGGNGSMIKWVNKEPALGFTDHIHFTRRGAAYMGDLFCSALRMHYDYFKFRDRHNISDEKLKDIHKWSTEEQIEKEKNALPERTFLNVKRRTKKAKGGAKK